MLSDSNGSSHFHKLYPSYHCQHSRELPEKRISGEVLPISHWIMDVSVETVLIVIDKRVAKPTVEGTNPKEVFLG